jgi:phosphotransferase system HPr (HPr) family protein
VLLELTISAPEGLHARPAAELVRISQTSSHSIEIGRAGQPRVSASSMLALLGLGLRQGERVEVAVSADFDPALEAQILALFSA